MNVNAPPTNSQIAAAAVLLPAQLFLFNITTIAAGNTEYIASTLMSIIMMSMIPFTIGSLGIYLTARALTVRDQAIFVMAILPTLFLLIWIQSQLVLWDYGGLTGETIQWADQHYRGFIDSALWIFGILAVAVSRERIGKTLLSIAFVIAALQSTYATVIATTAMWQADSEPDTSHEIGQTLDFSKSHNIIHLVIDGFQSDIMEDLLNTDSFGNRYRHELEGFIFFSETLSVFPYTQFSVPTYLSGKIYKNTTQKEEFIDDALQKNSIMHAAKEQGYEVDLAVNSAYFTRRHSHLPHDSLYNIDNTVTHQGVFSDSTLLWNLSFFRAAPHFLKRFIYNDQSWLFSSMIAENEKYKHKYFVHAEFMEKLTNEITRSRAGPVYKLIHIHNTHRPMVVNRHCDFAGGTLPDTRTNLQVQSACTMEILLDFIKELKRQEIYNDALIIVHADHGGWVGTRRSPTSVPFKDREAPAWVVSLASPLLMVKPPFSADAFSVRRTLASLIDIPDTVSGIMDWKAGFGYKNLIDLDPDEDRKRRFMFYLWHRDEWNNDFTQPIIEYSIEGSHYDVSWEITDLHESPYGLNLQ